MLGITFGTKHSFNDWGVILEDTKVAPPQPKRYTVSVAGRNGVLDLTQELTPSIRFESRTLTFNFRVKAGDWSTLMAQIYGEVHGRTMDVISDLDPDWHWHGFVTIDDFSSDERTGSLVITVDADPFKYSNQMTTYTVEGNGTIVAVNDRMEVSPTIFVDHETQITFGDTSVTVSPSQTSPRTLSGELLSFDDSTGADATNVTVNIEPLQSGSSDPSPTNVRAISGWDSVDVNVVGKNLLPTNNFADWVSAGSYKALKNIFPKKRLKMSFIDKDTSISLTGIFFGFIDSAFSTGTLQTSQYRWAIHNGVVQSNTSNAPNNGDESIYLDGVFIYPATQDAYNKVFSRYDIQVELGTTATSYEPYNSNSNTTTVNLGQTVYGGSLNVTTGVLTIDRAYYELQNITSWSKSTSYPGGFYSGWLDFNPNIKMNTPFMCSHAKTAMNISEYQVGTCFCDASVNIRIMDASTTVAQWEQYLADQKTAGTPVTICAYINTPTTVQLTSTQIQTLLGQNNVWADAGSIDVTYTAYEQSAVIVPEIELKQGDNTLSIESEGTTIIQYTQGRL